MLIFFQAFFKIHRFLQPISDLRTRAYKNKEKVAGSGLEDGSVEIGAKKEAGEVSPCIEEAGADGEEEEDDEDEE